MPPRTIMAATKPKPLLSRVRINKAKFFVSLSKIAVKVAAKQWAEAAAELPETVSAIGLANRPAETAWLLIERSINRAVALLLREHFEHTPVGDIGARLAMIDATSDATIDLEIDDSFFSKPQNQTFVRTIIPSVEHWLIDLGFADFNARNISSRLPAYVATAFDAEWRSSPDTYTSILEHTASPFASAASLEAQWLRYRASLARDIEQPVFQETFSLRQIYVPPRCYYLRTIAKPGAADFTGSKPREGRSDEAERIVVETRDTLVEWVKSRDKDFALRVLAGGPGTGKSSFCKMFAHYAANVMNETVVLIPLHRLDMHSDFPTAVSSYLTDTDVLSSPLLELCDSRNPLLLILDGLDELEMQGNTGMEIAQNFVREVIRSTDRINNSSCRIRVLISGREISIQEAQSDLRKPGQVLWLLPYFISDAEKKKYIDPNSLLDLDQRDVWWRAYGRLKGLPYTEMPKKLIRGEIGDVTSQPLLNYLVALSFQSSSFSVDGPGSVNLLYEHLVKAVHVRAWAADPHPTVRGVSLDAFFRLLEEVALAVWHGDGRKTTVKAVEAHCKRSNIATLLPGFEKGAETGIASLFLAFYFRQHGRQEGEKTFEFTHKSFGEYLAARRIVRAVEQINQKIREAKTDLDAGWTIEEALYRWLSVCGPTALDEYVLPFIQREILLRPHSLVTEWQETLTAIYSELLHRGWPVERQRDLIFKEQLRWARNAEETFLAALNGCSRHIEKQASIKWPSVTAFGDMVKRLQGQRNGPQNRVIMRVLSYTEAKGACLDLADLYGADLSESNFSGAFFHYSALFQSTLRNSDLSHAVFYNANLNHTDLEGAILDGAKLDESWITADQLLAARSLNEMELRRGALRRPLQPSTLTPLQRERLSSRGVIVGRDPGQGRRKRSADAVKLLDDAPTSTPDAASGG